MNQIKSKINLAAVSKTASRSPAVTNTALPHVAKHASNSNLETPGINVLSTHADSVSHKFGSSCELKVQDPQREVSFSSRAAAALRLPTQASSRPHHTGGPGSMDISPRGIIRPEPEIATPRNLKIKMSQEELPLVSPRMVPLSRQGTFCEVIPEKPSTHRPNGILKQRRRESEFIRMKEVILDIQEKKNKMEKLTQESSTANAVDTHQQRQRLGEEVDRLKSQLLTDAKENFRCVKGISRGDDDLEFTKNIKTRIIGPSKRLQKCLDHVHELQMQGARFEKFLKDFREAAEAPEQEVVMVSQPQTVKAASIPLDEACSRMLRADTLKSKKTLRKTIGTSLTRYQIMMLKHPSQMNSGSSSDRKKEMASAVSSTRTRNVNFQTDKTVTLKRSQFQNQTQNSLPLYGTDAALKPQEEAISSSSCSSSESYKIEPESPTGKKQKIGLFSKTMLDVNKTDALPSGESSRAGENSLARKGSQRRSLGFQSSGRPLKASTSVKKGRVSVELTFDSVPWSSRKIIRPYGAMLPSSVFDPQDFAPDEESSEVQQIHQAKQALKSRYFQRRKMQTNTVAKGSPARSPPRQQQASNLSLVKKRLPELNLMAQTQSSIESHLQRMKHKQVAAIVSPSGGESSRSRNFRRHQPSPERVFTRTSQIRMFNSKVSSPSIKSRVMTQGMRRRLVPIEVQQV